MRDLDLFRRLRTGSVSPIEIELVATWPLARRGPFLGRMLPLVAHADPAMRTAALHVLAGCRGAAGVRAIVNALDDADPAVWQAALAALRATAMNAPARYVHALFHPRPEIRRAACVELPRGASGFAAYLRADPATADLAEQLAWPDGSLPLAFDLYESGQLAASAFATVVLDRSSATIRSALEQLPSRDAALVDSWLDRAVTAGMPAVVGRDAFDTLVAALASLEPPLAARLTERIVELGRKREPRRLAVALLAHGSPAFVPLAAILEPRLIGSPSFAAGHADAFAAL